MSKKFIIINRDICIGCGACVAASEGKCDFHDGKAWCKKEKLENYEEIISVCPVDCISASDNENEYDEVAKSYDMNENK